MAKVSEISIVARRACPYIFSCRVSGDLSYEHKRIAERFARKTNQKFEKELLRAELLSECDESLVIYVPDAVELTVEEIEFILGQAEEWIEAFVGAWVIIMEYHPLMKLRNPDGQHVCCRIARDEFGMRFSVAEISPEAYAAEEAEADELEEDMPCEEADSEIDSLFGQGNTTLPMTVEYPISVSAETQLAAQKLCEKLNEEIGIQALDCQIDLTSPEEIDEMFDDLKYEDFNAQLCFFADVPYSADTLKRICKTFQKVLNMFAAECGVDRLVVFPGQRIPLDDGHTWVEIDVEDGEVIWRDEYCPYEGEYARALQQIAYGKYEETWILNEQVQRIPSALFENSVDKYMPFICRMRAMRFGDMLSTFFGRKIQLSSDSLADASLFLHAIRNSLTADRMHLRKDASPAVKAVFKELLHRENEDGQFELLNIRKVLDQDIVISYAGWLGEILRENCANLVWVSTGVKDSASGYAEAVLQITDRDVPISTTIQVQRFFYGDRCPDISSLYETMIDKYLLRPAVKNEYRFNHLLDDNQSDNIVPFRRR